MSILEKKKAFDYLIEIENKRQKDLKRKVDLDLEEADKHHDEMIRLIDKSTKETKEKIQAKYNIELKTSNNLKEDFEYHLSLIKDNINNVCKFYLKDIGYALEKIINYYTKENYQFKTIHGIIRYPMDIVEVEERHQYIASIISEDIDNTNFIEEGYYDELSCTLNQNNVIVLNKNNTPIDTRKIYGLYELNIDNIIYKDIINDFFNYAIDQIINHNADKDIISIADLYIHNQKKEKYNFSRTRKN